MGANFVEVSHQFGPSMLCKACTGGDDEKVYDDDDEDDDEHEKINQMHCTVPQIKMIILLAAPC